MKKILMVLMGLDIGGAETHVVGLSLALQQMGWEVLVASNGGVYEQVLSEAGIRHFQIPTNTRSPWDMHRSLLQLRRLIQEEQPDLVHAHARIPAFLCGILHRQMGFPFVTTAHWVFRVNPLLRFLTDWGQQTIAVSTDIRDYLIDRYDLPASQIHVTVNGIDTDQFSPSVSGDRIRQELDLPASAPVITCVTRLHESRARSAQVLLESAPTLAKAIPGLRILLVGDGEQLGSLRQRAQRVNQSLGYDCALLTGGRTDIPELVAAGDVFIGVSRAALEAMSCGKPTILCGNEGYGGLATEAHAAENRATNYCCRGCPESTGPRLTEDLLRLFSMDEPARQEIGLAGRDLVLRDFSLMAMARDCEEVYELALHPRKKIVISGYYGYGNLGDDTILKALCRQYAEEYDLTVLSKTPRQTAKAYGITAIPRFRPSRIRRIMQESAMLLFGGGSLLQDRTSTRSLLYYLSVIHRAQRMGLPVMVYANGIGPITGKLNRRLTAKALSRVNTITLRDEDSLEELRRMGVTRDLTVTADPVFALKPVEVQKAQALLRQAGIPTDRPLLGVSLRTLSRRDAARIAQLLDRVCTAQGCIPVFLCMQPSSDQKASSQLRAMLSCQSYLLPDCSAEEMAGVIGCMEAVISMRLHTIVFAAAAGTPVLGFDYDPKISSMLHTLGMPSLGALASFQPETAAQLALEILKNRPQAQIRAAAARLQARAQGNDAALRDILEPDDRPRRVLHIIGGGDTGGAKTHVLSLLKGLMNDGYQVDLVCFIEGPFAQEARDLGIPTTVLPRNRILYSQKALEARILALHPDIIHCHGAKANMFGWLLRRRITQPLVTTVHSDPWLDYLGRPMADLLYGSVNHMALRRIPNRICVSDTMRELLTSKGFDPKSLSVIYNGVDFSAPPPALTREEFLAKIGLSYAPDSVIFGIAARLSPVKDIPTLLEAFSRVVRQEPTARLVVAGDGEEAEQLRALAGRICPEGTVCFAGWLQDTDSFYGAIDVNTLTSLSEGFPYALPEGGRMHCATIASAVGGIPYMILDGETGLLFRPGDVEALTRHMLRLIREPETRRQLGEAMYQRTRAEFSLEATVHTQERIYRELLSKH
jgi:polysaccharide pyruvyl transferase CsaB